MEAKRNLSEGAPAQHIGSGFKKGFSILFWRNLRIGAVSLTLSLAARQEKNF
jgi:hypothetical protein